MTYIFTICWYSFTVKLRKLCPITVVAGEIYMMNDGGPIRAKQLRLVPNIPNHDTWLNSRIICSSNFWIIVHACLIRYTMWRGSFLVRINTFETTYHFPYINFHFDYLAQHGQALCLLCWHHLQYGVALKAGFKPSVVKILVQHSFRF